MRRSIALGLALGLMLLLALGAIAARLGFAVEPPRPEGPWVWVATRAVGVTALVALALDGVFGLALSTGALDRWLARARSVELHQTLSRTALTLTAAHALLLLVDPFLRYDVFDLAIPGVSTYRPWAVAAGIVAADVALVVQLSFGWRTRLGPRTWRRLHYLSFLALLGALSHGLVAGSDTNRPGMRALYVVITAVLAGLVALRGWLAVQRVARRRQLRAADTAQAG